MEKELYAFKGNKDYLLIIGVIILMVVVKNIEQIAAFSFENFRDEDLQLIMGFIIPATSLAIGPLCFFKSALHRDTYIRVFENHIEGKALVNCKIKIINFKAENFYLNYEQINNISLDWGTIKIYTSSATYVLTLKKNDAEKVYNTFNQIKNSNI